MRRDDDDDAHDRNDFGRRVQNTFPVTVAQEKPSLNVVYLN